MSEPANVTQICARAFQLPIYQFDRYYQKLSVFIGTRAIEELAELDVLEDLRSQVSLENKGQPEKAPLELERLLRQKIAAHYYEVYGRVQTDVQNRWNYEQAIKRAYFHVTELEDAELENWRKYLDYEEKQGDFTRTSFLYERCLVACALYDEFWLRYARWMYSQEGKEENTRIIYMRASCIFVPIEAPTVRLNWARLEEKIGRTSIARDIYISILEQAPGHRETLIALANVERRNEGNDAAVRILDDYIAQSPTQIGGVLAAEQARILWQSKGSVDEARQIFKDKHENFADSQEFWLKYLEFEIAQPSTELDEAHKRVKAVHDLVRSKSRLPSSLAKGLSHFYMDFLMDRGGKDAAEEYLRLDREVNGYVSSAKSTSSPNSQKRKGKPHDTANKRHRK